MIKNIVFDLGGVLLTEDDNWLLIDETKELLGVNNKELEKVWEFAWLDARNGKINEDEFFKRFLQSLTGSFSSDLVSKLKRIYRKRVGKLNALELLPELKRNYRIFALTNITKDWLNYKVNKFNLNNLFDLIISSCNEGVAKPNEEIFLSLIEKAKINPEESLFIDNFDRNIKPAKKLGFKTILFKDKKQMVKEMESLGIKV